MTDVRIEEVHTSVEIVDGPRTIDLKELHAMVRQWLAQEREQAARHKEDAGMRDRAWRSDVMPARD